jgi:SAM-dependent methyltransferase
LKTLRAQQLTHSLQARPAVDPRSGVLERVTRCDLCGGRERVIRGFLDDLMFGTAGRHRLVECWGCGLRFLDPRPAPRAIEAFYPDSYEEHQPAGVDRLRSWQLLAGADERIRRSLAERLRIWLGQYMAYQVIPPRFGDGRVLDVGCANGSFLDTMKLLGWRTHGVELCERAARIAARKGHRVVVGGSAEDLRVPERDFDLVYLWHVLEHTFSPRRALENMFDVLRPGGRLMMAVPNHGSLQARLFGRLWSKNEPPRHLFHFTRRPLVRYLEETGFEDIQISTRTGATSWATSCRFLVNRLLGTRLGSDPAWLISLLELPVQLAGLFRFLGVGGDLRVTCTRPRAHHLGPARRRRTHGLATG